MSDRLDLIRSACDWVGLKGGGGRDSCRVSTGVRWADWDRKVFSPAMCVLWWGEVRSRGEDGYETFWIPPAEEWISRVARHLGTDEGWVQRFVDQCYTGAVSPEQHTLTITFEGVDGYRLSSPRMEWKRKEAIVTGLEIEALHCLEKYGDGNMRNKTEVPYWTLDAPVKLYESKVVSAVYDLFTAFEAKKEDLNSK